jgi:hypothetical protein
MGRTPAECLTAEATVDGRRFLLCLIAFPYRLTGSALFWEVTPDNGADGEPKGTMFEERGTWYVDGGGDLGPGNDRPAEATPSVLKVDCMLPDGLHNTKAGAQLMNQLIAQVGSTWSDAWEAWS